MSQVCSLHDIDYDMYCMLCAAFTPDVKPTTNNPGIERMVNDVARRDARAAELEANRPRLIDYLKMKQDAEDWHGVQNAASDLRDLDSELDGLRY